ncbi:hypothetical protein C900_03071 [Fulvivirga imtechensis AK7]|uniref:Carrier domain-containing protein n=1 Tax=Fulvivirga imtechensis AK7 TaxID=1237149 RepID=L8JV11_9BACT|nr:acyl carrier protein [Fulvivirga imtechensis]ELR71107.1 hypothetical protein C900_03071 [Fulvivirga imtechensis AK7]
MNEEEIKNTIFHLLMNIAPDTEPGQLQPNDNIRQTLAIDSFDYLQFIVAMDKAFGMETPEEDYGKIETLDSLMNYIGEHQHSHG